MNNQFKEFNENLFKSVKEIKWYDQEGVMSLDDNRYIIFRLDDVGTRDHYNGYWVEVYNKVSGLVNKKFFRFKYHLDMSHRSERDKYYHVWYRDNDLDWYISRPKNSNEYVKILMDYINNIK
jgi:hypothetical protein